MVGLVFAGHGHFASGAVSGIEMIFGPQDNIGVVEFVDGETKTELDAKLLAELKKLAGAEHIVLFCDVLRGSPFQSAAACALADDRIRVIFGANVAMALEAVVRCMTPVEDFDGMVDEIVTVGKEGIGVFDCSTAVEDGDDW